MAQTISVNGAPHSAPDDPRVTLLDFLRQYLGLTGTKKGCDHGQCGACTVIVNGVRINSCLTLAAMHDEEAHAMAVVRMESVEWQVHEGKEGLKGCEERRR